MKGYYDGPGIWSILFVSLIFLAGFIFMVTNMGYITISFSGEPEIRELTNKLVECGNKLDEKCEPCIEVECVEPGLGNYFFPFLFGTIVGFFYSIMWGEDTKKYIVKKLSRKEVKE